MQTQRVKFNYPFREAGEECRREAISRKDYDPVSLFRWGNMLGMAVLKMLEYAERELGQAGQKTMINALIEVGKDIGRQMLEEIDELPDVKPIEFVSAFASWINREIYASLEEPRIEDEEHCSFDILFCPHQRSYKAFDCRVQRYLVQGMIDALREKFPEMDFQVKAIKTIPASADVCRFEIRRKKPGEKDEWELYSDVLARKALERANQKKE
jgi:predicted hydrocarbon binding protein